MVQPKPNEARQAPPGRRICAAGTRRVARGFSLVEILVVVLILSFGLLGLAGLQAATVRFKTNSWVRSATANLFTDMADRIRANPAQTGAAFGSSSGATSAYLVSTSWADQQSATLTVAQDCLTQTCTAAQRATFDLTSWRINARRMMPQGAVNIQGDRATGFTLTLAWFDKEQSTTAPEICTATVTGMAAANCCPTDLEVGSTNGVRCVRMTLIP